MGFPHVLTAILPVLILADLVIGSVTAHAGPLAEAVEKEIRQAVDSTLAGQPRPFPSDPLVARLLDKTTVPFLIAPEVLTDVAAGICAVYPDYEKRDPEAREVINVEGDAVRQTFVRFLLEAEALKRASDTQIVVRAFVKLLSLEVSEPTRAALILGLKKIDPQSLGKIASGLKLLAERDDDDFGVLHNEVHRARESLALIIMTAVERRDCEWLLAFSKHALTQPVPTFPKS